MTGPLVIGLGGNVGTDAAIIARFGAARAALAELGPVQSAPLYRTAPLGPAQPAFLNTAVMIEPVEDARATVDRSAAATTPGALIAMVLDIERRLGRTREPGVRNGPRLIDLDVLVWGARQLRTPALELPHPRLGARMFALAPLVALVGEDFVVPGLGRAGALLSGVSAQPCAQIAASW